MSEGGCEMQIMHSGGHNAETDSSSPRVYFLTDTKFYELIFSWSDSGADHQAGKEMSDWQAIILSALHELPMNGYELTLMTDNVHDGNSTLLHISSRLKEYEGIRCTPTRVGDRDLALPRPILFVVPCFTTQEIHRRIEAEGDEWHYGDYMRFYQGKAAQPPQPSDEPLYGENSAALFDVMPMSRKWEERIAPKTRLTWTQVNELIQQAEQAGGCIALRYYAESNPPDGKVFDTLEWLNATSYLHSIEQREIFTPLSLETPQNEE
jgi:hypothetical protein